MSYKPFSIFMFSLLASGCALNTSFLSSQGNKSTDTMQSYSDGNGVARTLSFNYDRAVDQEAPHHPTGFPRPLARFDGPP
ncbi:MAG TPA: hypothetical protein DD435_07910 [Cyanobacteria bacterium UBA8530]|nr:hypothetical protein [Cyanobacteria bacterium UBA8530]